MRRATTSRRPARAESGCMKPSILRIERAPGDLPRAVEQLNGDLLVPAEARPLIEKALLLAQDGLTADRLLELAALGKAQNILGVRRPGGRRDTQSANLLTVRPI